MEEQDGIKYAVNPKLPAQTGEKGELIIMVEQINVTNTCKNCGDVCKTSFPKSCLDQTEINTRKTTSPHCPLCEYENHQTLSCFI